MDQSNYQQVYDSLAGQYQPQTDLINKQITELQPQQDAQQASLDQAKVNAFKDITNQSNSRGVLFSGVPIDQQATYVGTKYLPAVANLKTSFNNTKNTLLGQINTLGANRQRQAQDNVASYQKAQQDAAYKQAQLQLGYARLGASKAAAAAKPLTQSQTASAIRQGLESVKGRDSHVAPQDLRTAFQDWTQSGFAPDTFWKNFQGYWNPNQSDYGKVFYG